jgi:hypothetical protein
MITMRQLVHTAFLLQDECRERMGDSREDHERDPRTSGAYWAVGPVLWMWLATGALEDAFKLTYEDDLTVTEARVAKVLERHGLDTMSLLGVAVHLAPEMTDPEYIELRWAARKKIGE